MSIYSDKLAHLQVAINFWYSVAQICTRKVMLARYLGVLSLDELITSYFSFSGQMLASISGDFFGDSELAGLTIEQPVAMEYDRNGYGYGGSGFNSNQNWELSR